MHSYISTYSIMKRLIMLLALLVSVAACEKEDYANSVASIKAHLSGGWQDMHSPNTLHFYPEQGRYEQHSTQNETERAVVTEGSYDVLRIGADFYLTTRAEGQKEYVSYIVELTKTRLTTSYSTYTRIKE